MKGVVRSIAKPLSSKALTLNKALVSNKIAWNQNFTNTHRSFSTEAQATTTPIPEAFQKNKDPVRDENGMLARYVRNNQLIEAEAIFNRMPSKGLVPNEYTYNIALNLYKKKQDTKKLFEMFEAMKKQGIKPSTITYSTIFGAFEDGGDVKDLLSTYKEMKDTNVPLALPIFNVILTALAKRGEVEHIQYFLGEINKFNFKPDQFTMSSVISAYGRKGDLQEMVKQWEYFVNTGVKIDEKTFFPLLDAYAKKGNVPGLLEWFKKYKALGFRPSTKVYNILIDGFYRTRAVESSLEIYEEIKRSGVKPDRYTYANLFRVIGISGNPELSTTIDKLFTEMRDTFSVLPDGRVASAMLVAFGKLRKAQKVLHVLEMVESMQLGLLNVTLSNVLFRLRTAKLIFEEAAIVALEKRLLEKSPQSFATREDIQESISLIKSNKSMLF